MEDNKNIAKIYEPRQVEDRLYKTWMDKGYFTPKPDKEKKPFTIVIPPPNVTGQLHMGHALDETLQDILIRWKRMQGYSALWLPGTDHAGIATQIKVEEMLRNEEGLTRYDLGREKFLEKVWEWKNTYGDRIINQLKKLGSSCDWSRERFTMDEGCSKAVKEVFVNLYNKGLIYKGNRIINWCPDCTTALSDAEVEHEEKPGNMWHIKYPIKDSDEYIVIATTRPETMLGDTAVAVHPEDDRYKHLVGKVLILPLVNREIPIIADEYVDKDFGSGAVKITPSHDPNDFEVGIRHDLPQIRVLNDDATINSEGDKYEGMDRYEARKAIVNDLKEQELIVEIKEHNHSVGQCYRCSTVVEPITSKQWFVKMKPLAEAALEVVKDGTIKFVPDRFSKIYLNWMENVHDWCISRQLWWGHRIPAYYCEDCGEMIVSKEEPEKCSKCGGKLNQDEDVLDTWFSSALWPFSTLGWPDETEDLKYFYPTSVLVTAYDIIFFWVARMIFSAIEHTGKEPFKYVFIHGLIRDPQGRKMSKSLNNGIDPLEVIKEYGADALRFTLATGNSPGNDMRFNWDKVESSRNFANKIWNASRFVLMNLKITDNKLPDLDKLALEDKWIVSRYNSLVKEVTENLEKFELGIAVQKLYEFIWDEFCDWYIELVKPRLYDSEKEGAVEAQYVLTYVLSNTLKLLHPFMPFITEEIWLHLPHVGDSIMISSWPEYDEKIHFSNEEKQMRILMEAIKSIRNIRAEMNVVPSRKVKIYIATNEKDMFEQGKAFFEKLAGASETIVTGKKPDISDDAVSIVVEGAQIYIPLEELIDIEAEINRLEKEKERLEGELKRVNGKLNNPGFVNKAPANVVEEEKQKAKKYSDIYDKVNERLQSLSQR
jgi:valyl-tRNA synthetase